MAYFSRSRMVYMALDMYTANEQIRRMELPDKASELRLLIECQQKALVIGEYLESLGMDYTDIVSKFEVYCNYVYEIAENLDDREFVTDTCLTIAPVLESIINDIENKIVEISSIDIYDFRGFTDTEKEHKIVEREIDRLIDSCLSKVGSIEPGEEYSRPLVVGNY